MADKVDSGRSCLGTLYADVSQYSSVAYGGVQSSKKASRKSVGVSGQKGQLVPLVRPPV